MTLKAYMTRNFFALFWSLDISVTILNFKNVSQKNSSILVGEKLLFSLQKCPRDWERAKAHTKAYEVNPRLCFWSLLCILLIQYLGVSGAKNVQ